MSNILVSACLIGINCRYDGKNCLNKKIVQLSEKHNLIPVCPESFGKLRTPRLPCEIKGGRIFDEYGMDFTANYFYGSLRAIKVAEAYHCKYALLKSNSPSCGKYKVYDGTFSGKLVEGTGVACNLFLKNGIKVYDENEIDQLIKDIESDEKNNENDERIIYEETKDTCRWKHRDGLHILDFYFSWLGRNDYWKLF